MHEPDPAAPEPHVPVLLRPVLEWLGRAGSRWLLDGTLGAGGHAAALLEAAPNARLLGLDRDAEALALARERLGALAARATLVHAAFDRAPEVAEEVAAGPFDGVLLDVGVSSMQVDRPERGFSFRHDGPLDMRMDPSQGESAADLVASLAEGELADLIYQLGEERHSRRIARAIVERRARSPVRTTGDLADLVRQAVPRPRPPRGGPRWRRRPPIDPATRTFQALRIAVNDELGQLERALPALRDLLAPGGRLAVISFHSLEDRRVKHTFRAWKQAGLGAVRTKKPVVADEEESARNPRARSAKLRVFERGD